MAAILPIVTGEDTPILRTKTKPVPKVTKAVLGLLEDMLATVEHAKGAGIAAPQVGRSERACIVLWDEKHVPLINPNILWKGSDTNVFEEGCLSLPSVWRKIRRPTEVVVQYVDSKGREQERRLSGFNARVTQHEVDHLNGVLIVDYPAEL